MTDNIVRYITCSVSGSGVNSPVKEGMGSLIEILLTSFCLARKYHINFVYSNILNIGHAIHNGIAQDVWDKQINKYIKQNLIYGKLSRKKIVSTVVKSPSAAWELTMLLSGTANIDTRYMQEKLIYRDKNLILDILPKLREHYYSHCKVPCYFNSKKTNIAIHIRKMTSTDCNNDAWRQYYSKGNYMEDYFLRLLANFQNKYSNAEFHIYSQGTMAEFASFSRFKNIKFHLDEHPVITMHHLIKADILVMSKSSFSYVAYIYSRGKKFMREPIANIAFLGEDLTIVPGSGEIK